MLIYLFAVLSLVGADPPPPAGAPSIKITPDCLTKYACYVPKKCYTAHSTVTDNVLEKVVDKNAALEPTCNFLFKIHPFAHNWYRIVMESIAGTTKIELSHKYLDGTIPPEVISCMENAGQVKAQLQVGSDPAKDIVLKDSNKDNLKCEFDIDLRAPLEKITDSGFYWSEVFATVHVGGVATKTKETVFTPDIYCVPGVFKEPTEDFGDYKSYAKAKYEWTDEKKWDEVYCDKSSVYHIEYRPESGNGYEKANIKCSKGYKVTLDSKPSTQDPLPLKEDFDVRCVADAAYFCDYDPKYVNTGNPNESRLKRDPPDITSDIPKKSKLECPDKFPFFVKKGLKSPVEHAKFKCKNFFGKMIWTFNGTILGANNPVYCVKEVDCSVMDPIPRARLEGSFLERSGKGDLVPTCQSKGTLMVGEGKNEKEAVQKVECDRFTGKYNYHVIATGVTKNATTDTIYSCKYPLPPDVITQTEKKNAENDKTIKSAIPIAAGVAIVVAAVVLALVLWLMDRRMDEANRKLLAVDALDSNRFTPFKDGLEGEEKEGHGLLANDYLVNDYLQKKRQEALIIVKHIPYPTEVPIISDKATLEAKKKENNDLREAGVRKFEKTKIVRTTLMDRTEALLKANNLPKNPREPSDDMPNAADMEMKTQSEEKPTAKKAK